ncbi:hypothetical protein ACYZTM_07780 [Pseudomonas sp. MDT2-39-1]
MSTHELLSKLVIPSMKPVEGQEYEGEVSVPTEPGLRAFIESGQGLKTGDHVVVEWKSTTSTQTVFDHKVTAIEEENPVHFYVLKSFVLAGLATIRYEVTRGDMIFRSEHLVILVK